MADAVNNPAHYQLNGFETIDVVEALDWGEGFNRGNCLKYLMRAGKKDPDKEIEDLEKAAWYLTREIGRLKGLETSREIERLKSLHTIEVSNL